MSDRLRESFERLSMSIKDYAEDYLELLKIRSSKVLINVFAALLNIVVITVLGSFALLFLGFGLAIYLNQSLGSVYLGFVIVGSCFVLVTLFFVGFSRQMVFGYFRKHLIKHIFDEDKNI